MCNKKSNMYGVWRNKYKSINFNWKNSKKSYQRSKFWLNWNRNRL